MLFLIAEIYLKIFAYDVTDLNEDKYYEIQDTTGETSQYFLNNCHVIKTDDLSWSEGNNILVQTKTHEIQVSQKKCKKTIITKIKMQINLAKKAIQDSEIFDNATKLLDL